MGGLHSKRCGAVLTDIGDRSKRDDVAGVGISIRALYAARAAMVLSCAGFLFGRVVCPGPSVIILFVRVRAPKGD